MTEQIVQTPQRHAIITAMPDIEEYEEVSVVAADPNIPYTSGWIRKLIQRGLVKGESYGGPTRRAVWLVHVPSLHVYIKEMEELGPSKFRRQT